MTDRIPLDDMTSDQLDHLYNDLAWAEAEAASADASASSHADRANTAEATLARVHAYAVHAIDAGDTGPGPTLGRLLLQLLDGDTAATEATRPATWLTVGTHDLSTPTPDRPPGPCPACRRADQAGLAPDEQHDDCTKEQR
jgi:hypothetical protein